MQLIKFNIINLYSYISNLKSLKTIFLTLLVVFLSHYIYNTIQFIIELDSEVIVNIDDFDSEEENTETEDEVEELDEYLFDENSKIFLNSVNNNKSLVIDLSLLSPFEEVDSPPPLT